MGYAQAGRVDVCTVLANEMALRNLLHEMGHVWIDQNVSPPVRDEFLQLRGLRAWNASSDPWDKRGYEQGAEIMANAGSKTVAVCPNSVKSRLTGPLSASSVKRLIRRRARRRRALRGSGRDSRVLRWRIGPEKLSPIGGGMNPTRRNGTRHPRARHR